MSKKEQQEENRRITAMAKWRVKTVQLLVTGDITLHDLIFVFVDKALSGGTSIRAMKQAVEAKAKTLLRVGNYPEAPKK